VKEFLSLKGVNYREYDVANDEQARKEMLEKTGRMAVPAVVVGSEVVVGFDRSKLDKLI
jgi:glutaredoxin 3